MRSNGRALLVQKQLNTIIKSNSDVLSKNDWEIMKITTSQDTVNDIIVNISFECCIKKSFIQERRCESLEGL